MPEHTTGQIFLIPSTLGENTTMFIPEATRLAIQSINFFIVENERSARRFLRSVGYEKNFDEIVMLKMETDEAFIPDEQLIQHLQTGNSAGVLSEAGFPGIADPGAAVVSWAHRNDIKVIPLSGPSSILLGLMASGLNGQQFAFHGYLPVSAGERRKKLKQLEEESARRNQTQIFMETPYRNNALLKDILDTCGNKTLLCIASNLTLSSEIVLTKMIGEWKKEVPDLNKKPTIFLILAG